MDLSKIQYASDLHLEFPQNKAYLKAHPIVPEGEILLLAGDIMPIAEMHKHKDFFSFLADNFKAVYWIPGNHEYYYFDAATKNGSFFEKIRSNFFLLNNKVVDHENTQLIFSTLWSAISPANEWMIEKSLSDFNVIKYNGYRFSADKYNAMHEECRRFIESSFQEKSDHKTIVITHHVPTMLHYPEIYKGSILNEAFATELFDLIEPSNVDHWIFGHHHFKP